MASVKKSAIQSRQGHPTGIIDDVILPLIQKSAKMAKNKTAKKSGQRAYSAYTKAGKIEKYARAKRIKSYESKAQKNYARGGEAFLKGDTKNTTRLTRKADIASAKSNSLKNSDAYWSSPNKVSQNVKSSYKMVPARKPTPKAKSPRKIAAVKPKRKGVK